MHKALRYGFASLSLFAFGVLAIPNSEARSVSAFMGQPQNPNDYTCFVNGGGTVGNVCGSTRRFCEALPVDSSGHTVEVSVFAPDVGHNISCFAQAVDRFGNGTSFTPTKSPSIFGSSQVVSLGSLSVVSAGALYTCCDISPSSAYESVNY